MTRRPLVAVTILAVLAAGPAACSSGGNPSTGASADASQLLELGRRFAQCARDHGYPNFPDPAVNDGRLGWHDTGVDNGKEQVRAVSEIPECKPLMEQIQAANRHPERSQEPPSAADLAKLQEFAQCIREHGIPEWPDPKADGSFPVVGTPLEHEGRSERFMTALDACKNIYDKRIVTS